MNAIKIARQEYDCRELIGTALGEHNRSDMYHCPFHEDSTPSFKVYKDGYHCYGCGEHGDVFDWLAFWQKRPLVDVLREHKVDPQAEETRKREYLEREAAYIRERLEKLETGIAELRDQQLHMKYYEIGGTAGKEAWEARGVPGWYQDFTYLGYDPDHRFWIGEEYRTPTLTIPVYEPGSRDLVNIRHRLLNPCDKIGKYRPERSGLPASLFAANPDEPLKGRTILVEGEIKAIVTWVTADSNIQVVGSPSKNLSTEMFGKLTNCDPIYYIPDPDATQEIPATVAKLGKERTRVIYLPTKIDDYILQFHLDCNWMNAILRTARKI